MITAVGNPVYDEIETPFLRSNGRVLSGCSTNFCLAMAKLGVSTALVGNVGADMRDRLVSDLTRFGVRHTLLDSAETGGFSLRYYGEHGERELKLLGDAGPIAIFPDPCMQSDYIVFGPILGEVDRRYVEMVRLHSKAKIVLDPQGVLRSHLDGTIYHRKALDTEELISLCDIVKPNELECSVLTGIDPRIDAVTPANMIRSWGPELVVITLAELGSVICDGTRVITVPAYETDVGDSTGAGDTYLAGLVYGLMNGWELYECGCMGSAVASIMIEQIGPDFPLTVGEAERRRDKLLTMKPKIEFVR